MNEFKKGQLVACWDRDDCDKAIRIYVGKEGMFHRCRLPGFEHGDPDFELWEYCVPLEELAPEAFLARERRAGEQAADAVAMESELVQRLKKQIAWLCSNLTGALNAGKHCPPNARCDGRVECEDCWSFAAEIATEEEQC